jgi:CDP-diacylglycerol---glycerol-3-phosphate 3-phosphatidyltransferase
MLRPCGIAAGTTLWRGAGIAAGTTLWRGAGIAAGTTLWRGAGVIARRWYCGHDDVAAWHRYCTSTRGFGWPGAWLKQECCQSDAGITFAKRNGRAYGCDGGIMPGRGGLRLDARQIPNLLGLFRIVTTPLLYVLILWGTPAGDVWAVVLLLLMAVSDIVDGRLARQLQVVSPLGVFLDTISDKIFVTGALLPMVERGLLPGWVALLIILREFAVSGLRSFAAAEGEVISARQWGKQKLVFTVAALIWCLLNAAALAAPGTPEWARLVTSAWPIVMGLALIWTVGSGVEYFWKALPLMRAGTTP